MILKTRLIHFEKILISYFESLFLFLCLSINSSETININEIITQLMGRLKNLEFALPSKIKQTNKTAAKVCSFDQFQLKNDLTITKNVIPTKLKL